MLLKCVFDFELVFLNKQNWAILILTLSLVALQANESNTNEAQATLNAGRCVPAALFRGQRFLVPDPWAWARWSGNPEPGLMYRNGECFVF